MHILSALVFALVVSIDNFTVGIAYGSKKIKIKPSSNLLIGLFSSLGTFLSMVLGLGIIQVISAKTANLVGCVVLLTLGIYFLIDFFKKKLKIQSFKLRIKQDFSVCKALLNYPEIADVDKSGSLELRESIMLAFALTLNNFGLGIGVGITGINIFQATLLTFIISIVSILIGYTVGEKFLSKFLGDYASLFSGCLIIILSIYEIFK
ncbi:MAG: sporulation membrane protein YtaF [Clostridiaceae bacterium]|nr:sporulation membrane protein YtaF [Clostridiaceae bacterium]